MMQPTPEQMLRDVRRWVWLGYAAQSMAALGGALCLWAAIDDWLTGHPFRSACFTVIAFWNGYNFVNSRLSHHRTKRLLHKLRDLIGK
jgi:hypothetical protein